MHKLVISIFFVLALPTTSFGSDSVVVKGPIKLDSFANKKDGVYFIFNKIFIDSGHHEWTLFSTIRYNDSILNLTFKGCRFDIKKEHSEPNENDTQSTKTPVNLIFEKALFKTLRLANLTGTLSISNSFANQLSIENASNLTVSLSNIKSSYGLSILNSKKIKLNINKRDDTAQIKLDVSNSTVDFVNFDISGIKGDQTYTFSNDTIGNIKIINTKELQNENVLFNNITTWIIFNNCYLNGNNAYNPEKRLLNTGVKFINCTFGPKFDLYYLGIEQIEFENCKNISRPIEIRFERDSTQLRLINTDASQLNIQWFDHMWLVFAKYDNYDQMEFTFQNLLDKYQKEGIHNSYKRVDILYKTYTENFVLWNLDKHFWNHGYNKNRVFWWTLLALVVFIVSNFLLWDRMQKIYSLLPISESEVHGQNPFRTKLLAAILYTAFIFFSLSVKLDRLKLSKNILVIFFFFQYLVGLFFLFFIIKAILKW